MSHLYRRQMMYLRVLNGDVNHMKDVAGRLQKKRTRKKLIKTYVVYLNRNPFDCGMVYFLSKHFRWKEMPLGWQVLYLMVRF